MKALIEKRNELDKKNKKLAQVFEEAGKDMDMDKVKCLGDNMNSHEKAEKIKQMNDELTDIGEEVTKLVEVEEAYSATKRREEEAKKANRIALPGDGVKGPKGEAVEVKSLGQMFIESKAYKNRDQGMSDVLDIEIKTLFQQSAGWTPESLRTGRIVESAQRPIQVTDIYPAGNTGFPSVKYMEETLFTNAAAERAEGAAYAEAALKVEEKSATVESIGVSLPITDEQLEDVPRTQSYIDNRLRFMLQQRLDGQTMVGNGTTPNLRGLLNVVGIQSQAKAGDPTPDTVYKAMTKVRVTGRAIADTSIMHPNDWQDIRLLRTADGIYIWGSPSQPGPDRIWGLPVVQADSLTENTGIVGDFRNFSELITRRGIIVKISDSHDDFFIKGKKMLRADVRVVIIFYRPTAYCQLTGI